MDAKKGIISSQQDLLDELEDLQQRTHTWGQKNQVSFDASKEHLVVIHPRFALGDDFRMPVVCDVPVVFVNGDWDVKTPVENMHEIAPYFPRGHPIVVHRCGHGTMTTATRRQHPKFIGQLAEFLETGDRDGLPHQVTVRPTRTFRAPEFGTEPSSR